MGKVFTILTWTPHIATMRRLREDVSIETHSLLVAILLWRFFIIRADTPDWLLGQVDARSEQSQNTAGWMFGEYMQRLDSVSVGEDTLCCCDSYVFMMEGTELWAAKTNPCRGNHFSAGGMEAVDVEEREELMDYDL